MHDVAEVAPIEIHRHGVVRWSDRRLPAPVQDSRPGWPSSPTPDYHQSVDQIVFHSTVVQDRVEGLIPLHPPTDEADGTAGSRAQHDVQACQVREKKYNVSKIRAS